MNMDRLPNWGGNALRIFIAPFAEGKALLPGEPLTAAADQYSLGIVLYEALRQRREGAGKKL